MALRTLTPGGGHCRGPSGLKGTSRRPPASQPRVRSICPAVSPKRRRTTLCLGPQFVPLKIGASTSSGTLCTAYALRAKASPDDSTAPPL